jgi:hypothetical protein
MYNGNVLGVYGSWFRIRPQGRGWQFINMKWVNIFLIKKVCRLHTKLSLEVEAEAVRGRQQEPAVDDRPAADVVSDLGANFIQKITLESILRPWATISALWKFTRQLLAWRVFRIKISFRLHLWKHSSLLERWRCSCKLKSRRNCSWGPCFSHQTLKRLAAWLSGMASKSGAEDQRFE